MAIDQSIYHLSTLNLCWSKLHEILLYGQYYLIYFCVLSFRSTDSQLKLWNVAKPNCTGTFKGHINEKNFVGLATDGDYVACGR